MAKITLPKSFSVTSSITQSDGLLYGVDASNNRIPVVVQESTVLGPKSYHALQKSKTKFNKEVMDGNPHTVDIALLPPDTNILMLEFSVSFTGALFNKSYMSINDPVYKEVINEYIYEFIEADGGKGMDIIVRRLVNQTMSGEWFWRNLLASHGLRVDAEVYQSGELIATIDKDNIPEVVYDSVKEALQNSSEYVYFNVRGFLDKPQYSPVYPSQEFSRKEDKNKELFKIQLRDGTTQAGMHSQKIGNKIRRVDDWYGENVKMIPIYPYGHDREEHIPRRTEFSNHKAKNASVYCYLDNIDKMLDELTNNGLDDRHYYLMSQLFCGGVFSSSN